MSWYQTLKLLLVRPGVGDTLDISQEIESVDWSGSKWGAPRSLTVTVHDSNRGWQDIYTVHDDNHLVFYLNGDEIFRGKIFSKSQTKQGKMTLKAYDDLVYLTKNSDHYVFQNQKASDIMKRLCDDFQISYGTIVDTGYVIPKLVLSGRTLYDMIMKALKVTYDNTGVRYHPGCSGGKVNLTKSADMATKWIIEEGTNLINWTYTRSMENMITKIKLESQDLSKSGGNSTPQTIDEINANGGIDSSSPSDNTLTIDQINSMGGVDAVTSSKGRKANTITAIATNDQLMKQFGILQHYERANNNENQGQLQARAQQMLQNMAKVEQDFDIEAIGIPGVISGGAVQVIVPYVNMKKSFYVIQDNHTFTSNSHKMTLTLQDTDELPDMDATDDSNAEV